MAFLTDDESIGEHRYNLFYRLSSSNYFLLL